MNDRLSTTNDRLSNTTLLLLLAIWRSTVCVTEQPRRLQPPSPAMGPWPDGTAHRSLSLSLFRVSHATWQHCLIGNVSLSLSIGISLSLSLSLSLSVCLSLSLSLSLCSLSHLERLSSCKLCKVAEQSEMTPLKAVDSGCCLLLQDLFQSCSRGGGG